MLWGEQAHLDGLGEQDRIEPSAGLDVCAETSPQTPTLDPVDLSFLENSKAPCRVEPHTLFLVALEINWVRVLRSTTFALNMLDQTIQQYSTEAMTLDRRLNPQDS